MFVLVIPGSPGPTTQPGELQVQNRYLKSGGRLHPSAINDKSHPSSATCDLGSLPNPCASESADFSQGCSQDDTGKHWV